MRFLEKLIARSTFAFNLSVHHLKSAQLHSMPCFLLFSGMLFSFTIKAQKDLVLICKDSNVKSLWLNTWTEKIQSDPALRQIGTEHKTSQITIAADQPVRIKVGAPLRLVDKQFVSDWDFEYYFLPGDTVLITMGEYEMPLFAVQNSADKFYEHNLEYFMVLKQKEVNPNNRIKSIAALRQAFSFKAGVVDSLHRQNLISDSFYTAFLQNRPFIEQAVLINFNNLQAQKLSSDSIITFPVFDDSLIKYSGYLSYMKACLNYLVSQEKQTKPPVAHSVRLFDKCLQVGKNSQTMEQLLYYYLPLIDQQDKKSFSSRLKKYLEVSANEQNKQALLSYNASKLADQAFADLHKNQTDKFLNEKTNKFVSLSTILKEHKGKVVYIDFWASWCAPCIAEMKPAIKLKEEFSGKPFVILSISLDQSITAWKKRSSLEQLNKATSYLLANPKSADLVRRFNLKSIPRYFLIDKNGKIIDNDAERPGSTEIVSDIKKLL